MAELIEIDESRIAEIVKKQLEDVLATGSEQEKSMVLARVKYICQDIKDINASLNTIKEGLRYVPLTQKLVFGFVALVLVSVTGALLASVVIQW